MRAVQALDHVVIDRFTGGVIPTLLYVEEVLDGGSVGVTITIQPPPNGADGGKWPDDVRKAFLLALRDLCRGRLAIGAKSHGFCIGRIAAWGGADAHRPDWEAAWKQLVEPSSGKAAA